MRNEVSNYKPACRAEDENQYEFMSIRFSGEGTSRREKCSMCFNAQRMLTKLFTLFVLDMYFFFSLLSVNKEKKKYQEKEKSTQPIRICKNYSARKIEP